MGKNEIFEKIKEIVIEQLSIEDADSIKEDTNLVKDLDADSLYVVEVIMAIEEEFGITIPDEAAEKFETVNDIVSFVESAV